MAYAQIGTKVPGGFLLPVSDTINDHIDVQGVCSEEEGSTAAGASSGQPLMLHPVMRQILVAYPPWQRCTDTFQSRTNVIHANRTASNPDSTTVPPMTIGGDDSADAALRYASDLSASALTHLA
jgi:hypothetical protein